MRGSRRDKAASSRSSISRLSPAYWHSPDGVSFTGVGPSWSWSPDSTRFFVTMSVNRVIAVDVRDHPFRQVDIDMPNTPFHGIAVTQR